MRVLLVAEACNPEMVSVPLEGWSHSRAIARLTDAHLVTQIRNRDAILRAGLIEGKDFTAIDSEPVARRAYQFAGKLRGGAGKGWAVVAGFSALAYPFFEHLIWKQLGQRIKTGEFDLVHRLIPLSPATPSWLAGWCRRAGVPFVLGPLNGGVPWPKDFESARRQENEWFSYFRDAQRLLPGYRATRRNAAGILIGSRQTWRQMPRSYLPKCVYIPENAIDPERFTKCRTRRAARPVRAVYVGRMVPLKAIDVLIEAAAPLLRNGSLTLELIGDGPQMPEWRELAHRQNVQHAVNFAGWVKHSELQDRLMDADVFTFPSIREFGGAVVLEAMAVGLVPIVMDYGGPGELVTDQTGFRVPMGTRREITERLRALLTELVEDPRKIDEKSGPAMRRARGPFTWDAKAAQTVQAYEWVLGRRKKPNFGMPLPDPPGGDAEHVDGGAAVS